MRWVFPPNHLTLSEESYVPFTEFFCDFHGADIHASEW